MPPEIADAGAWDMQIKKRAGVRCADALATCRRILGLNAYRHWNRPGLRRPNQATQRLDDLAESSFHLCFVHQLIVSSGCLPSTECYGGARESPAYPPPGSPSKICKTCAPVSTWITEAVLSGRTPH